MLRSAAGKPHNTAISAVCFGVVFVILLTIASFAVKPAGGEVYDIVNTTGRLRNLEAEDEDTIDVLFAGNSLVFRDISPMQIWGLKGITSYDLSDGAMRLCDQQVLIDAACKRQHPRLLVLEAGTMFSNASPYKDDYALPTNLLEKIFPIFHYHEIYKSFSLFEEPEDPWKPLKGFDPSEDVKPYEGDFDYISNDHDKPSDIPSLNREYLDEILDHCRKNNISLLITAMPSPENYDVNTHEALKAWTGEKGLPFLDLNTLTDEIGIDWQTDTKDHGDHLNLSGSKKVSAYLADYLSENYDLEDHRGEERFAKWDEALQFNAEPRACRGARPNTPGWTARRPLAKPILHGGVRVAIWRTGGAPNCNDEAYEKAELY